MVSLRTFVVLLGVTSAITAVPRDTTRTLRDVSLIEKEFIGLRIIQGATYSDYDTLNIKASQVEGDRRRRDVSHLTQGAAHSAVHHNGPQVHQTSVLTTQQSGPQPSSPFPAYQTPAVNASATHHHEVYQDHFPLLASPVQTLQDSAADADSDSSRKINSYQRFLRTQVKTSIQESKLSYMLTTVTQRRFFNINYNYSVALAYQTQLKIQSNPTLRRSVITNPNGISCADVCDCSGAGFGTLGICTNKYCQCEPTTLQPVELKCERNQVFDPLNLKCDFASNTALCRDDAGLRIGLPAAETGSQAVTINGADSTQILFDETHTQGTGYSGASSTYDQSVTSSAVGGGANAQSLVAQGSALENRGYSQVTSAASPQSVGQAYASDSSAIQFTQQQPSYGSEYSGATGQQQQIVNGQTSDAGNQGYAVQQIGTVAQQGYNVQEVGSAAQQQGHSAQQIGSVVQQGYGVQQQGSTAYTAQTSVPEAQQHSTVHGSTIENSSSGQPSAAGQVNHNAAVSSGSPVEQTGSVYGSSQEGTVQYVGTSGQTYNTEGHQQSVDSLSSTQTQTQGSYPTYDSAFATGTQTIPTSNQYDAATSQAYATSVQQGSTSQSTHEHSTGALLQHAGSQEATGGYSAQVVSHGTTGYDQQVTQGAGQGSEQSVYDQQVPLVTGQGSEQAAYDQQVSQVVGQQGSQQTTYDQQVNYAAQHGADHSVHDQTTVHGAAAVPTTVHSGYQGQHGTGGHAATITEATYGTYDQGMSHQAAYATGVTTDESSVTTQSHYGQQAQVDSVGHTAVENQGSRSPNAVAADVHQGNHGSLAGGYQTVSNQAAGVHQGSGGYQDNTAITHGAATHDNTGSVDESHSGHSYDAGSHQAYASGQGQSQTAVSNTEHTTAGNAASVHQQTIGLDQHQVSQYGTTNAAQISGGVDVPANGAYAGSSVVSQEYAAKSQQSQPIVGHATTGSSVTHAGSHQSAQQHSSTTQQNLGNSHSSQYSAQQVNHGVSTVATHGNAVAHSSSSTGLGNTVAHNSVNTLGAPVRGGTFQIFVVRPENGALDGTVVQTIQSPALVQSTYGGYQGGVGGLPLGYSVVGQPTDAVVIDATGASGSTLGNSNLVQQSVDATRVQAGPEATNYDLGVVVVSSGDSSATPLVQTNSDSVVVHSSGGVGAGQGGARLSSSTSGAGRGIQYSSGGTTSGHPGYVYLPPAAKSSQSSSGSYSPQSGSSNAHSAFQSSYGRSVGTTQLSSNSVGGNDVWVWKSTQPKQLVQQGQSALNFIF